MKRTLEILGVTTLVAIILPYGKGYAPSILGGVLIQRGSLILVGLLVGFSGVLALHRWFSKKGSGFFLGILIIGTVYYGHIYAWYRLSHSAERVLDRFSDHGMMHTVAKRAQDAADHQKRHEAAAQYFRAYGVELGYVDSEGALVRFSPDEATLRERLEWIETMKNHESSRSRLEAAMQQTRTNLGLFPGMIALGILAASIVLAYRKPEWDAYPGNQK